MAILFVDGFDHYQTSDILMKWDSCTDSNPVETRIWVDDATPRTGGLQYLHLSNQANSWPAGPSHTDGAVLSKIFSSPVETLITGFAFRLELNNGVPGTFFLRNSNGQTLITFQFVKDTTFDKYGVKVIDTAGSELGRTSTTLINPQAWYYIETKTTINNTTGSTKIRLNGATHLDLTNINTDPSNGLYPGVNDFNIKSAEYYSTNVHWFIDDLYLSNNVGLQNNDFLGDVYIQAILPESAGSHTDWTPSAGANFECVNEVDIDEDASFVSTTVDNAIDTYNFTNVSAITGSSIKAVVSNLVAKKDGAAIRHITPIIRQGGLEYQGLEANLTDEYRAYQQIWELNPADSQSWEISDIDNAEFGVKLVPNA